MVTHGDVRELALALPDVREEGPLAYSVRSGSARPRRISRLAYSSA